MRRRGSRPYPLSAAPRRTGADRSRATHGGASDRGSADSQAVKSLDSFDFAAIPSLNKTLVLELARSEYVTRRENVIAVGNSGTGKTHIALGIGLAACQKGLSVGFYTAAALVHELLEARDEKRLLRLQRQVAGYKLLIIDELGYVPSRRPEPSCCSRYSASATSAAQPSSLRTCHSTNGQQRFGYERLTGALLDRLTRQVTSPRNERGQLQAHSEEAALTPHQRRPVVRRSDPSLTPTRRAHARGHSRRHY